MNFSIIIQKVSLFLVLFVECALARCTISIGNPFKNAYSWIASPAIPPYVNILGEYEESQVDLDDFPMDCSGSKNMSVRLQDKIMDFSLKVGSKGRVDRESPFGTLGSTYMFGDNPSGSSINILRKRNGQMIGSIIDAEQNVVLQMRVDSEGNNFVQVTPSVNFPPEADPANEFLYIENEITGRDLYLQSNSNQDSLANHESVRRNTNETPTIIDIMVVWTKKSECANSGKGSGCIVNDLTEENMKDLIILAVQETNTAYELSGVNALLRLVYYYRSDYVEPASNAFDTSLANLRGQFDGDMDEVHSRREFYGADVVALLIDDPQYCGIGYIGPRIDLMFSVTSWNCAVGNLSFAHEVGHNIGLLHDRGTSNACDKSGYNYGYRDPAGNFRTIMAYNCRNDQCDNIARNGCSRIQRFSTPNLTFSNRPLGTSRDNSARWINEKSAEVANYYEGKPICTTADDCTDYNGDPCYAATCDFICTYTFICKFPADGICGVDHVWLQIDITPDSYPSETSWTLTNACSGEILADFKGSVGDEILGTEEYNRQNGDKRNYLCVDKQEEYTFTINDTFGDGICCGYGSGQYSIEYEGMLGNPIIGGSFQFTESRRLVIGNCPTFTPSYEPTKKPSTTPTMPPTQNPSEFPSLLPSKDPTETPTHIPSSRPSSRPTKHPSDRPSEEPSFAPTNIPSNAPTASPTDVPSGIPSETPTETPSISALPSTWPSFIPSANPSEAPTSIPSYVPSSAPSSRPSTSPSPSEMPSATPSVVPSKEPSDKPSDQPSSSPSDNPSNVPSNGPSAKPSVSVAPTDIPSSAPTDSPSNVPSTGPSSKPTHIPSSAPTEIPSSTPTDSPSNLPSNDPSVRPSHIPSIAPTEIPSSAPTVNPSTIPTTFPSESPTIPCMDDDTFTFILDNGSPQGCEWLTKNVDKIATRIDRYCPRGHVKGGCKKSCDFCSCVDNAEYRITFADGSQQDCEWLVQNDDGTNERIASFCYADDGVSASDVGNECVLSCGFCYFPPTRSPTRGPTENPTDNPSAGPSAVPSLEPSLPPLAAPSSQPTTTPSSIPSVSPTMPPTRNPSEFPSLLPSKDPTETPTHIPSSRPSSRPTKHPSDRPSEEPTLLPTNIPSNAPTVSPTDVPSGIPSNMDTERPSISESPSTWPSFIPSANPSEAPTSMPSYVPSSAPSSRPSTSPSPSEIPNDTPSVVPSKEPSDKPSDQPSSLPSYNSSNARSRGPSFNPSIVPSITPTEIPSSSPTDNPSNVPSHGPSSKATQKPSDEPSHIPSIKPSDTPSNLLSQGPSVTPSTIPSIAPTEIPSVKPYANPSNIPSNGPSSKPTRIPSKKPSTRPTTLPSDYPTVPCMDDDSFTFILDIGNPQGCEWLTRNVDKIATRTDRYCPRGHVKGACKKTCDFCPCVDNAEYRITLDDGTEQGCQWLVSDAFLSVFRIQDYCFADDGVSASVVGNECVLSCGFCL